MSDYSKFNIVYRLQKWMDSVPGQTFLNYAYSWGASIVILGTLFKLTHLPGADVMLFIGMGTEVFVFFLSAFDRPFDKTADGRDIPTHVTDEYLRTGQIDHAGDDNAAGYDDSTPSGEHVANHASQPQTVHVSPAPVYVSPEAEKQETYAAQTDAGANQPVEPASVSVSNDVPSGNVQTNVVQPNYVPQMSAEEAEALNEAQGNYVDELKKLVETLGKVNEQSQRLTRDSEEMENLNRTLTGISKVYEMQLKGASQQIGTIDQINEQTRKMAQQIEQLNKIYARMIEAMTVNMRAAAPGAVSNSEE